VAQNHHWTSDVLTGAAIGTLSTHLVYLSYNFLSDLFTKNNLTICPYPVEGGGGVYLSYSF
jgi:membrane-associated phospholipid phosphatase